MKQSMDTAPQDRPILILTDVHYYDRKRGWHVAGQRWVQCKWITDTKDGLPDRYNTGIGNSRSTETIYPHAWAELPE